MLERAQRRPVNGVEGGGFELQLDLDDLLDLREEPGVDLGQRKHLIHTHALGKGVAHVPDALGAGLAQLFLQHFAVLGFLVHTVHAHFEAAQCLLERLLEGAAHGHDLAHGLHLRGEPTVSCREFLKGKTRDLGHNVVNAGLKAGRGGTTRDLVAQLVQGVTDRQLGRHLGNREASGLGGQCRRA